MTAASPGQDEEAQRSPPWRALLGVLAALVAVDLVFMALHVVHRTTSLLDDDRFSLGTEQGFGEMYGYLKVAVVVAVLVRLAVISPRPVYVVWAAAFAYLLADDALELHERGGEWLAERFDLSDALGLRAVDFGELVVYATVGVVLLVAVAAVHVTGDWVARRVDLLFLAVIGAMVVFGVGFDMLQSIVEGRRLTGIFGLIEDGGELLAISAAVFVALSLHAGGLIRGARTRRDA